MGNGRHFRFETLRGEPYLVGKSRLIPIARIVSYGKARGSVGQTSLSGVCYGFAAITPLAIVEETEEDERSIAVADAMRASVWTLLGSAVALTVFFTAIRRLAGGRFRLWGTRRA